jgi:hypothetical protein
VTDGVREFIKGEVRQETTEGITGSLVQQAMQAPSNHVITQQTTQSGSLATDTTTGGSTMEYIRLHGKNAMDTLVTGGSFDQSGSYASLHVADATGTEGVRGSVKGKAMQESTHGIAELSTQQTTTQSSSELDFAQQTIQSGLSDTIITTSENTVDDIRLHPWDGKGVVVTGDLSGQSGSLVLGEVANVSGTEAVLESVTAEIVGESTQGITDSSTLHTTQMSYELDIAQRTTQSGSLITDTLISNGVNDIQGRRRDGQGPLIAGDSSSRYKSQVSRRNADVTAGVVRETVTGESTITEDKNESSSQQTMQTMQTSSELSISQQTTQSGSRMTGTNTVDYLRLHGRDTSSTMLASESSG